MRVGTLHPLSPKARIAFDKLIALSGIDATARKLRIAKTTIERLCNGGKSSAATIVKVTERLEELGHT